jgi:hypothetical protein
MTTHQKNHETLVRAASGDPEAATAAVGILLRGIRAYFQCGGQVDLARCCGLPSPTARRKFDLLNRDLWLCAAARQIEAGTPWDRSVALGLELRKFTTRIWPAWQGKAEPPPGASKLHTCLFRAVLATPAKIPTTTRHLHRIVGAAEANTQRSLHMKTMEVIEREARLEWQASSWLRDEYTSLEVYLAFRRAEAKGRFNYASDIDSASFVTNPHP